VSYLASRADVLMTTAILLMAWALVRGWWVTAGVCALLAMGFKEIGVVAVLIYACWPTRPWWILGTVTCAASMGLIAAVTMMKVYATPGWVSQQAAGLGAQLTGLLMPWTLVLAPDPLPYSILGTMSLFVAGGLVLAWSWSHPVRRFSALWIASCVVLRFVIPTPQSVLNSHQMYAAMVGVCLWVGSFHGNHAVQQRVRDYR